ncbi:MAG: hypothetical protein M3340_13860 [Actinomycetota bacterium]|nr:hypothetical protein [Actinomycetota bacterium]
MGAVAALGPLVGGTLVAGADRRWIFVLSGPVGSPPCLVALLLRPPRLVAGPEGAEP